MGQQRSGEVLLDLDLDFMVDGDYGWGETVRNHRECFDKKRLWPSIRIPGKKLGKELRYFRKGRGQTKTYVMVDHHESLFWWDTHIVERGYCIHIDGHHDLWRNSIPKGRKIFSSTNRKHIDCGNYLRQALSEKIVSKVLYVPSPYRSVNAERKQINNLLHWRHRRRVAVRSWETFLRRKEELPQADIITIAISPEWFPRQFWVEAVDLFEELRVPAKVIDRRFIEAERKWDQLEETNSCGSFKFPYDGIC